MKRQKDSHVRRNRKISDVQKEKSKSKSSQEFEHWIKNAMKEDSGILDELAVPKRSETS